ncbi:MAG: hypothetical protein AAB268_05715 [Elusimicrobiota bacterium]
MVITFLSPSRGARLVLAAVALLTVLRAPATAQLDSGLAGVWTAQGLLAANPPLPMLRYSPGAWRVTLAPAYFFGEPASDSAGAGHTVSGRISGGGAGASASYAFAERWGVYVWMLGSSAKGHVDAQPRPSCATCARLKLDSISSSYQLLTAGAVYQASGDTTEGFTLPVFAGPLLSRSTSRQTVTRFDQTATLLDDFEMEVEDLSLGLALGAQAGVPIGRGLELNPFVMTGVFFRGDCRGYDVTRQGTNGGFSATSDSGCSGARQIRAGEDRLIATGGLNVMYTPWNISLNATAPFLGRLIAGEDAKITLLTLSWSFGSPRKDAR